MKTISKLPALFLACAMSFSASYAAVESIYANFSGEWDSDIWASKYAASAEKGLRPRGDHFVWVASRSARMATILTLSNKSVSAEAVAINTEGGVFEIQGKDTVLNVNFLIAARLKCRGTVRIKDGTVNVANTLSAGGHVATENANGTIEQSGGVVNVTGHAGLVLANGANSTGVYVLSGGTLNVLGTGPNQCIRTTGKGSFVWTGGTLNTSRTKLSLANTASGNLSPGGDGKVGVTQISMAGNPPPTGLVYEQGSNARMTVDVANTKSHDVLDWRDTDGNSSVVLNAGSGLWINMLGGASLGVGDVIIPIKANKLTLKGDLKIYYNGKPTKAIAYEVKTNSAGHKELQLTVEKAL